MYGQQGVAETIEASKPRPVAREKLTHVIAYNRSMADACQRLIDHINEHPEIEQDMIKVFGITPPPA